MKSHIDTHLLSENEKSKVKHLVEWVALGDIPKAKRLLTGEPNNTKLLLSSIDFTDASQNQFIMGISALGYAYWANDPDMLIMMKDFIKHEAKLLAFEELLNVEKIYGHYDLDKLPNAIGKFIYEYIAPYYENPSINLANNKKFHENVIKGREADERSGNLALYNIGKIQNEAPLHIMHEFFRETEFSLTLHKNLTSRREPLQRSTVFPDPWVGRIKKRHSEVRSLSLNPLDYKVQPGLLPAYQSQHQLGVDNAIFRFSKDGKLFPRREKIYQNLTPEDIIRDFNAVKDLSVAIKSDMVEFKKMMTPSYLDYTYSFFAQQPASIADAVKIRREGYTKKAK